MEILRTLLIVAGVAALTGLLLLALLYRRVRRLQLPADAGFFRTLRSVPLALVVALDLLDLGLDIFAAPLTWIILDRLNLKALRQVATLEAVLPFTGPIPTLTLCWLAARRFDVGPEPSPT